jgi:hypothetical protein
MTVTVIATIVMIIATVDDWVLLGRPDAHEDILIAETVTRAATDMVITTTMVASAITVREIVIMIAIEIEIEIETASETETGIVIVIEEVQGGKIALKGERNGERLSALLELEVQQWVF